MRLFAAVVPPDTVTAELADEVRALRQLPGADRLSWTGEAAWHFTLAFYGEVEDGLVAELETRLGRAAARREPFGLRLRHGGRFAHRVVWVGAEGDRTAMSRLAGASLAAGRRAGLPLDEHRSYTPHLTIARNRTDEDLRPFVGALAEFEGTAWRVGELCLIRSNLPGGGSPGERPRYETVGAWALGG
ncbi:RNA 2',3'-cyclic phosphodiesterase [Streptomyces sp. NPDC051776]|uniref:RNA 2',3'-cyclic phosphodiesterase n=1 Tax=Streptomyces sp. NPDC051776 TaxID=3155414 RepID=UPI003421DC7D